MELLERAKKIQVKLSKRVEVKRCKTFFKIVGGLDMAYVDTETSVVAYVETVYGRENVVKESWMLAPVLAPYIPTFLFLREGPPMLRILARERVLADVLLVNGHGLTHPRAMGLATYIGVVTGLPTIGVAKKHLYGEVVEEIMPGIRGIVAHGRIVGAVLRSRSGGRLYISVGHKVTIQQAVKIVLDNLGEGRLPIPLKIADALSKRVAREVREGRGPRPASS